MEQTEKSQRNEKVQSGDSLAGDHVNATVNSKFRNNELVIRWLCFHPSEFRQEKSFKIVKRQYNGF